MHLQKYGLAAFFLQACALLPLRAVGEEKLNTVGTGSLAKLSEEESFSKAIPDQHRCTVCKAVVLQLTTHLHAKGKRQLREHELEEVYEDACRAKLAHWQKYGAREIGGTTMLTGPGLLNPAPEPGQVVATSTGGVWADRLQMACLQLVEDVGETELYKLYRQGNGSGMDLDEEVLCVRQQPMCKADELKSLNKRIRAQEKKDAKANVQTASSQPGSTALKSKDKPKIAKAAKPTGGTQAKESKEAEQRRMKALRREIRNIVDDLESVEALKNLLNVARQAADAVAVPADKEEL